MEDSDLVDSYSRLILPVILLRIRHPNLQKSEIKGDLNLIIRNFDLNNSPPIQPPVLYNWDFIKYSRYFDGPINKGLRTGILSPRIFEIYSNMTYDIERIPETPSITLYRGINQKLLLSPGDKIVDKGFMSKSLIMSEIIRFTGGLASGTLMILHYPNPSRQVYMPDYSYFAKEQEMLSFPGEEFQVKARFTSGIYNIIYAEFLGRIEVPIVLNPGLDWDYFQIEGISRNLVSYLDLEIIVLYSKDNEYPIVCGHDNPIYLERKLQRIFQDGLEIVSSDEFLNQVEGLFYRERLTAIYRVLVDNYRIFKVRSRNQELEIEEEIDTIGLIDRIIQNRLEGLQVGIPLPQIEMVWSL